MVHNFRGVSLSLTQHIMLMRLFGRCDLCPKLKGKQGFQHMGNSKCVNMKVTTPTTKYSVCFSENKHTCAFEI